MDRFHEAFELAVKAHKNQIRQQSGLPFIVHPLAVMGILRSFDVKDEDILIAAVLHDVVEDSPIRLDEIEKKFGKRVAKLVDEVSKKEGGKFIITMNESALLKMADLIHNGLTMPFKNKLMINRYITRVEILYDKYKDLMDKYPEVVTYLFKVHKKVKKLN
jgi:(p)ppGpp synthase/HD superfamily hydrolase